MLRCMRAAHSDDIEASVGVRRLDPSAASVAAIPLIGWCSICACLYAADKPGAV